MVRKWYANAYGCAHQALGDSLAWLRWISNSCQCTMELGCQWPPCVKAAEPSCSGTCLKTPSPQYAPWLISGRGFLLRAAWQVTPGACCRAHRRTPTPFPIPRYPYALLLKPLCCCEKSMAVPQHGQSGGPESDDEATLPISPHKKPTRCADRTHSGPGCACAAWRFWQQARVRLHYFIHFAVLLFAIM